MPVTGSSEAPSVPSGAVISPSWTWRPQGAGRVAAALWEGGAGASGVRERHGGGLGGAQLGARLGTCTARLHARQGAAARRQPRLPCPPDKLLPAPTCMSLRLPCSRMAAVDATMALAASP